MSENTANSFNDNAANENLPTWDLDKLFGYEGYGSEAFEADYAEMERLIANFIEKYEGKIKTLSGDELTEAFEADSAIDNITYKMMTYLSSKNTQDSEAHSPNMQAFMGRVIPLHNRTIFFGDELKKVSNKRYKELLSDSEKLKKWEPVVQGIIQSKPHKLDKKIIEYSSDLGATSHLVGMYTRRQASLRFNFEGKELNIPEITSIIADDPSQERRAAANTEFNRVMTQELSFNTEIHNGLIKFKNVSDKWTKFDNPPDSRHADNNVKPQVVDALETAVKGAYERTSHRFYDLKAKLMGQEKLNMYDRNINILESEGEPKISWDEAKQIVLDAFYAFDDRAGEVAQKFFDEGWIDAAVSKNKAGGAYASPGAAALLHPLVMVNFQGTAGDVKTLAHELGHGIHQYMAAHHGDAIVGTPLTLAETASVFGEMLTFESLMSRAENDDQRRKLLFDKVNDMLNTVVRQISFYDFEKRTHGQYQETKAPLTKEDFMKHWNDVAHESLGPSVDLGEDYGPVFGYIPHIVKTPFYVYAYAFGDSLVNALWQVYEEGTIPENEFKDKFFDMLQAGGTYQVADLKRDFGLDVEDPAFWNKGLTMIEGMIDQLEDLCQPLLEQNQDADQDRGYDPQEPTYFP